MLLVFIALAVQDIMYKTQYIGPDQTFSFRTATFGVLRDSPMVTSESTHENDEVSLSSWPHFLSTCNNLTAFDSGGGFVVIALGTTCTLGQGAARVTVSNFIMASAIRLDSIVWACCKLLFPSQQPSICQDHITAEFLDRYMLSDITVSISDLAQEGSDAETELIEFPNMTLSDYVTSIYGCASPNLFRIVQSSVQHLFWECPKAKLVWNYFYALWAKIGITPGHDPAIWIFSLDLPDNPRHAWTTIKRHIIGHKCSNEHLQYHLYPVAHMLWRYMSASLIQTIWCAHLRRMDSDPIKSTAEMAIMMTRLEAGMRNLTRLAEAQAGDSDGHTVAAVLKAYVDCFLSQTDAIPLTPNDARGVYLLFFDGGSRGNPGPGGTGSIIVRVHKDSHTASLIWVASMAYSRKDTTNNFAEYLGLIHGLREAQRSHFEPFECIGPLDSTDWHVYTRQVDDSRIASTSDDGTITTVPSTRWRTQPPT
ncbi:hypothetical protein FI667_g13026, partial [Globisporangium splendens]